MSWQEFNERKHKEMPSPASGEEQPQVPGSGVNQLESIFNKKDLRILVETRLNMSQKCTYAMKANCLLGGVLSAG